MERAVNVLTIENFPPEAPVFIRVDHNNDDVTLSCISVFRENKNKFNSSSMGDFLVGFISP